MNNISKARPEVEELKVTPEVTPEIVPSNPTANQSKEQVHNEPVFVARFKGTYSVVVNMLEAKCKRKFADVTSEENYNEINIVLDSYDGARTLNNPKKKVNIISFSSQIFNERIICEIGWQPVAVY